MALEKSICFWFSLTCHSTTLQGDQGHRADDRRGMVACEECLRLVPPHLCEVAEQRGFLPDSPGLQCDLLAVAARKNALVYDA